MPPTGRLPSRAPAALLTLLLALCTLLTNQPAAHATSQPAPADPAVVAGLTRAARPLATTEPYGPLGDLRPFGRSVGAADLVGVGEGTHGTHEFFTLQHRLFRYLVEKKGFASFGRETGWGAGLDINAWVLGGPGDIRAIMRASFQADDILWANEEYARLFEWMRAHNAGHAEKLQFMGFDMTPVEPRLYDRVLDFVARHYPDLKPAFDDLYRGRPTGSVAEATREYQRRPAADLTDMAERARQAYLLLREQQPAPDPIAVQTARVIAQSTRFYAYPNTEEGITEALQDRDRTMAANVAWWHRYSHDRTVVSAHNSHVAYLEALPSDGFRRMGGFLRDRFGPDYTNLRTTFGQGSFNSSYVTDGYFGVRPYVVGPPPPGSNEYTLNKVPHPQYFADLRTLRGPARTWASMPRPSRFIGADFSYPVDMEKIALRRFSDMLIHLRRGTASHMLPQ
ncbi:erythromycin esterase family protein [Streptomyces meridianus]|uniref:Erythromycin esterase family protein n=1 Tax=Streptomyces meridianus TaxID=2938945 RepID=A0ABT0X5Q5_9ACTN|nr:erythromycin esterase family protein [Streptomyces meridianus]MCM2577872.1 erythromycin esterase family protein [Streptomyces meridianus]